MNKSQRIHFDKNTRGSDSFIKVRLEQETDNLEFLTMNLDLKDAYQDFNADYGVLVGRVTANGGVGIPNAKISIFIPLSDEDASNSEISSIYPYKTPRDKNNDGKRYNLLPRVAKEDRITGVVTPKQPFGSFPIKEETITNSSFLNVYKKYYKYTALTNSAGDYMIFGVPIGVQTVHLSVDITDIGKYSMTPAAMVINLGYSPNLFTNNNSKIKPSNDLGDLPNIETQEISVNVIPFWGNKEIFEIGITRQDFRIRSVLQNTFVIYGSAFTDGEASIYGADQWEGIEVREMYRIVNGRENIGIQSKRTGKVTEKIYYYPNTITDAQIDAVNSTVDPKADMLVLDPSEYSIYKRDGDFVFIISCNRNKVITNELGIEVSIPEDSVNGVFTKFRGFMTLEITTDTIPMNFSSWLDDDGDKRGHVMPIRHKLKFPQSATKGHSFRSGSDTTSVKDTQAWRKQHFTFSGGSLYSVAHFHGIVWNNKQGDAAQSVSEGFLHHDWINYGYEIDRWQNVGIIQTNDYGVNTGNTRYELIPNSIWSDTSKFFGANWLNFGVHLVQNGNLISYNYKIGHLHVNSNTSQDLTSSYYMNDNTQPIAAGVINTKWFARSDLHYTDFIITPKQDILEINQIDAKGFKATGTNGNQLPSYTLKGKYRNGKTLCPYQGGRVNALPSKPADENTYFFKGFDSANCIEYITSLGIV